MDRFQVRTIPPTAMRYSGRSMRRSIFLYPHPTPVLRMVILHPPLIIHHRQKIEVAVRRQDTIIGGRDLLQDVTIPERGDGGADKFHGRNQLELVLRKEGGGGRAGGRRLARESILSSAGRWRYYPRRGEQTSDDMERTPERGKTKLSFHLIIIPLQPPLVNLIVGCHRPVSGFLSAAACGTWLIVYYLFCHYCMHNPFFR